ncbi:MAG: HNH endonuclease, partial [Mycobacterium sp.]
HAYHYLSVFDETTGRRLWLGRSKRIASADQRVVLHERDRGCTFPGCTVPGYGCQVHHATTDWAEGGTTDIDHLDLACGPHNRLVKRGGWTTRKRRDGTTEWIPPPGKPLRGGTNTYHHPDKAVRRLRKRRD